MVSNPLVLLVAIPLGIGVVNLMLPVLFRKLLTLFGTLCCLYLVYLLYQMQAGEVQLFGQTLFSIDGLSLFAVIFVQILGFLILIFSLKGVGRDLERHFFILYPLAIAFCNGAMISDHAVSLLIFWGLSGVILYLFALLGRAEEAPETARKTFLIIGGSDAFLILGMLLLGELAAPAGWSIPNMQVPLTGALAYLAFFSLLIAVFAKAGGVPLHTWLPDFSRDAPVESAALLPASLDKLLGIYFLARMMLSLFTVTLLINLILISLGALTVIIGVMMALVQHNGRRLLGYHAVSQVGYMIMGVGSGTALAFAGGLFHLVNNVIYKSGLFLSLGSVEKKTGTNNLDELGGLGKRMPLTFLMALICALSISGIPPLNGFFSKWMVYQGLLEKAAGIPAGYQIWLLVCLLCAIFGSVLTLASFVKFIHATFLGKPLTQYAGIQETSANHWIVTGVLAFMCILFGLFAVELPLRQLIYPAMAEYGLSVPAFPGLYHPLVIFLLFGLAFLVGFVVYMFSKRVRYDEVYLGGMSPAEKFRVAGTEFYNEIRNMAPLRTLYDSAGKRNFDLYDVGNKSVAGFTRFLQKAQSGQLQLYLLYIIIGLGIILWASLG